MSASSRAIPRLAPIYGIVDPIIREFRSLHSPAIKRCARAVELGNKSGNGSPSDGKREVPQAGECVINPEEATHRGARRGGSYNGSAR